MHDTTDEVPGVRLVLPVSTLRKLILLGSSVKKSFFAKGGSEYRDNFAYIFIYEAHNTTQSNYP